jgi:hypothetical protein
MDGMTILNTYTKVLAIRDGGVTAVIICLILGVVIGLFLEAFFCDAGGIICVTCILVGFFLGIILGVCFSPETQIYTVVLDDSVSFVEFYQNFEVLKTEGQIYHVYPKG